MTTYLVQLNCDSSPIREPYMIATSSPQEAKSDVMKDLIKIKSECSSIVQNQTFWATLSTYNNGWKEDFDLRIKLK